MCICNWDQLQYANMCLIFQVTTGVCNTGQGTWNKWKQVKQVKKSVTKQNQYETKWNKGKLKHSEIKANCNEAK